MARPLQLLLLADDPDLAAEWRSALANLPELPTLPQVVSTVRAAQQFARSHQPDAICLLPGERPEEFAALLRELHAAAPAASLIGILDRRRFDNGDAESHFLVTALRSGCVDFLRRPLSTPELSACLRRIAATGPGRQTGPEPTGRITCFASNKGGVGKTTLAVNVACELARQAPGRVLLVDAALQLGLCATMLDLEPAVTLQEVCAQIDRLDATLLRELASTHACGLDLLAAPPSAVAAAAIREEHLSRILSVARTAYDHIVVDTFPILDGIAIAAFDRADAVWLVVAPTVPTVLGTERLLGLLEEVGVERQRQHLVLNGSVPPHVGRLTPRDVATRLGRMIEVVVPFSRAAVAACNTGQPVILTASRWHGFRRRITELAALLQRQPLAAEEQHA
jgi:pilus assembly protein CpaE